MSHLASSIFNDVIGPVMIGPSSSHTAGPTRIGCLAGQLLDDPFKKARFTFEVNGSFAGTYQGQKSDQGLIAGLMGWGPEDSRLASAQSIAEGQEREISFLIEEFAAPHPNTVKIQLESVTGEQVTATGLSVGGGVVELIEVNSFAVSIDGGYWEHLFFCQIEANPLARIERLYRDLGVPFESVSEYDGDEQVLINVKSHYAMSPQLVEAINKLQWVMTVKVLEPVMPILASERLNLPFTTSAQMLDYCQANKVSLWEAACSYEAARGNINEHEVLARMHKVVAAMRESLEVGLEGAFHMRGFMTPSASQLESARKRNAFLPTGLLDRATCYATAIMEYNSSMGCVVAAPTAGSCGVLPAVLFSAAESLDLDEAVVVKAMLCAGIVGVFIAEQATFAAEVCGCQAECGSAASMAAAALVWINGGTVEQSLAAASLAMQNMLGLICDPVAGQVEIPCISRNVSAAANAVTAANMTMFGFNATIPLDEVIKTMYMVGQQLPGELRCTGKGGLCLTDTGRRLARGLQQEQTQGRQAVCPAIVS